MKIGIDLDGIIYDFEEALRSWFYIHGKPLDEMPVATQWELAEQWGITRAEFEQACQEAVAERFMFTYGAPINDAYAQLSRLRKAGHTIHLITARDFGPETRWNTAAWLSMWRIPYDLLSFSKSKAGHGVVAMIDDKPGNIEELVSVGVDAYLQDRPYNRDFDYPQRVSSLKEFVDRVTDDAYSPSVDRRPTPAGAR